MTDKELQKLKRADLIEILYYLRRENDELKEENEYLKSRLDSVVDHALGIKTDDTEASEQSESKNDE